MKIQTTAVFSILISAAVWITSSEGSRHELTENPRRKEYQDVRTKKRGLRNSESSTNSRDLERSLTTNPTTSDHTGTPPNTNVFIPDGAVLCPGQDPANYCGCAATSVDCTDNPSWCACEEAVACCSAITPIPTPAPKTNVSIPDGTVLCPGQDPANYCDCTAVDCNLNPSWCACEEAVACCSEAYYPPPPPSFTPCDSNMLQFVFELHTDYSPMDNSWDVINGAGEFVLMVGNYTDSNTTYIHNKCLDPDDCYVFTFYDVGEDGLTAYSPGGYSLAISNNGSAALQLIDEDNGDEFFVSKSKQFGENCSPTNMPTLSPTFNKECEDADDILVIVEVNTDAYPSETSWDITDENGTIVGEGGPYEYNMTFTTITEKLCLDPDCYEFTINDSYGDGFIHGLTAGYTFSVDTGSGLNVIAQANSSKMFDIESTPFGTSTCPSTIPPKTNVSIPDGTVLCPGEDPANYCDCTSVDCTDNPSWCACEEAVACCSAITPIPTPAPTIVRDIDLPTIPPNTNVSIPDGAVLCPEEDPANYCDCTSVDCTGNPSWCACEEAVACCSAITPIPTPAPKTNVSIPDGAVLCPGQDPANYCDCTAVDCNLNPSWCACEEAVACCSAITPIPTPAPTIGRDIDLPTIPPNTNVSIPDGAVLCPGQDPANYCGCATSVDCTDNPSWCACEEAVACCSDIPPEPTPPPPVVCDGSDIIKVVLEINTDSHPMDTSWRIESPGSEIGGGGYTNAFTKYVENICLDPGCYEFYILDSYGDGFTVTHSEYEEAGYKLYADVNDGSGLVLLAEANYTVKFTSNRTLIGSCDVSTPPPASSPTMKPIEQPSESLTLAPTIKAPGDYFEIVSTFPSSTKWCIQPKVMKEGSAIVIGECDHSDMQKWSSDEYGRIQSKAMKYMCVTKAPFDRLSLEYCGSESDTGTMFMYNVFENTLVWKDESSTCFTISSYSPEDGDDVILSPRDRALLVQEWLIE